MPLIEISKGVLAEIDRSIGCYLNEVVIAVGESPVEIVTKRSWDPMICTPEEAVKLSSRQIYVVPLTDEFNDAATRNSDLMEFRIGVITCQKFPKDIAVLQNSTTNEDEFTEWVDRLMEWTSDWIIKPLTMPSFSPFEQTHLQNDERSLGRGIMRSYGLFWHELVLTYTHEESNEE
jgi:hypothetical protein